MKAALIILVLFLSISTLGQSEYEYGKTSELKGLSKLFIYTGPDVKSYDLITKELGKAGLPMLKIVEEEKDADIFMIFEGGTTPVVIGANNSVTTVRKRTGVGHVAIKGRNPSKVRILINLDVVQKNVFTDKPAEKLAKTFIKEYKLANEIK